jgi:hypothetical protein
LQVAAGSNVTPVRGAINIVSLAPGANDGLLGRVGLLTLIWMSVSAEARRSQLITDGLGKTRCEAFLDDRGSMMVESVYHPLESS